MKSERVTADADLNSFVCSFCQVLAQQSHGILHANLSGNSVRIGRIRRCQNCKSFHIWLSADNDELKLIHPDVATAPPVNLDAPAEVQRLYKEAAEIASKSPRAAAALLRLAVQVLLESLLKKKCNINEGIAELVKDGLPKTIQRAMDVLRLTGNDAVHPGVIDTDDSATVDSLFPLINFIAEKMLTEPKEIDALYQKMPEDKRKHIERRDGQTSDETREAAPTPST